MKGSRALALALVVAGIGVACLTTFNRPKVVMKPDAPALEARPENCHVDVLEGPLDRPHLDFADITLDWPRSRIDQQGAEGAMATLRASACEQGAFVVHDMRGLVLGTMDQGMVYEGTLATLLGDDGKPLNLKPAPNAPAADAGPAPVAAAP
jgi:hypothetical protein